METVNRYRLTSIEGFSRDTVERMADAAGSATGVLSASPKKWEGMLTKTQYRKFLEIPNEDDAKKRLSEMKKAGIRFVSCMDKAYPKRLRNIPSAPAALYFKGALPDPGLPSVAIIGARMCSEYGRYMARLFGNALGAASVQVISGMALGVDGIAQRAALNSGGYSCGVLGSGVDVCYPEENRGLYDNLLTDGCVLSEYAPGTAPKANLFPMRNRIIAGLSDCLLVVEARRKSGTLITVDQALSQGKDVFALPGRATDRLSDGCNELIKQGAIPVTTPEELLECLMRSIPSKPRRKKPAGKETAPPVTAAKRLKLSDDEKALLEVLDIHLKSPSDLSDALARKGALLSVPTIMHTLVQMTLKGLCVQEGGYFRKKL